MNICFKRIKLRWETIVNNSNHTIPPDNNFDGVYVIRSDRENSV